MNTIDRAAESFVRGRVEFSGEDESPNISSLIDKELKQAFLAGAKHAKPRWISVSERLPESDGTYLVYPEGKYHGQLVSFTVSGFCFDGYVIPEKSFYYSETISSYGDTASHAVTPTHWMPLPSSPEAESK